MLFTTLQQRPIHHAIGLADTCVVTIIITLNSLHHSDFHGFLRYVFWSTRRIEMFFLFDLRWHTLCLRLDLCLC